MLIAILPAIAHSQGMWLAVKVTYVNHILIPDCYVCRAKTEGLVRYPTTLAPGTGSVEVLAQCADNAHTTSSSLTVTCIAGGAWSMLIPQCQCNEGYNENIVSGRSICEGIFS